MSDGRPACRSLSVLSDMALRIHFPWQFLLTVLGFAALGAGVGYLQAHDFHGQLYRQLAVHAAGAAFVGACAWFLSERVSHAVNLNTSPFFRLALSGAAATGVAAFMVGPYIELATASTAPWAEPAAAVFYVAVGVMPMVAVVSLLAFGEALLAARRGDADLKSALRPIRSAAVVGALLGGVAAYGAIDPRLVTSLMINAGDFTYPMPGAPGSSLAPGANVQYYRLPEGGKVRLGIQADTSFLPTGVYTYTLSVGVINNGGTLVAGTTQTVRASKARKRFWQRSESATGETRPAKSRRWCWLRTPFVLTPPRFRWNRWWSRFWNSPTNSPRVRGRNRRAASTQEVSDMSAPRDWSARNQGSGTFVFSNPKRKKSKMRLHRLKNKRRAR